MSNKYSRGEYYPVCSPQPFDARVVDLGDQSSLSENPDRTHRLSVKLVTLLEPKGAEYWKGDPSTIPAKYVERAVAMTKKMEIL